MKHTSNYKFGSIDGVVTGILGIGYKDRIRTHFSCTLIFEGETGFSSLTAFPSLPNFNAFYSTAIYQLTHPFCQNVRSLNVPSI